MVYSHKAFIASLLTSTFLLSGQVCAQALPDLPIAPLASTRTIDNTGVMNGTNNIDSIGGDTVDFYSTFTGDLSGVLNINSGLVDFGNSGSIHDLTINNQIDSIQLDNSGTITGTNMINSPTNKGFVINNDANGLLSGSMNASGGNLTINNNGGSHIQDFTMIVSNGGQILRVMNEGLINGVNTVNVNNGGVFQLTNESGGEITGTLNNLNSSYIDNRNGGNIHDFIYNNSQSNTGITNNGILTNFTLHNVTPSAFMTLFNLGDNGVGEISGNLALQNGKLYIANTGLIDGSNITADNNSLLYIYNTKLPSSATASGVISGTNTFNAAAGSSIEINNNADGKISGTFNTISGTTVINAGLIDGLTTENSQNALVINNIGAGELRNTLTFNNVDDNKVITLNNNSTDILNGTLQLNEGTLNLINYAGSTINGYTMAADSGTLNINNRGTMAGTNSVEGTNAGVVNLYNQVNASLGGDLTVKSGLNNFLNYGLINNLNLTNEQDEVTLTNSGQLSGSNTFINSTGTDIININNNNGNITGTLISQDGLFNLNNSNNSLIQNLNYTNNGATAVINNSGIMNGIGSLTNTSGTLAFNNLATGLLSGDLTVNSAITPISNAGTINNLNLYNLDTSPLVLNNTGFITGTGIWTAVDLNNQANGSVNGATLTSKDGIVNIANAGTISGNTTLSGDNGTFTMANNDGGVISGNLTVNSGLDSIENNVGGTIGDLNVQGNLTDFTITNEGSIIGSNTLTASNEFIVINNGDGTVSSNLTINAPITTLEQNSSGVFEANILGSSAAAVLNLTNSTLFNSTLGGTIGTLNLENSNTDLVGATLTLGNNGTIQNNVNINNSGYTQINNSGNIVGAISDSTSPEVAADACPTNIVEIDNNTQMSGNISIFNNIFKLNNAATGNVTSGAIDSRDLRLNNAGTFNSSNTYTFSVRDYMEVENTGSIYGKDMAFKLIGLPEAGKDVKGYINNSGTIYSQGTTIGYDGTDMVCPTCFGTDPLTINNSGNIIAVDLATLTNPGLNSFAIAAENAVVNNLSGGTIGGSMHVKDYTQKAGANWVTFMDKDLTQMSTITAENTIDIESGSILTIYTNNDVKAFTNGQKFLLVNAKNMNQTQIDAEIENFTLRTDSPFANYQMIGEGDNGYILFNHVDPTNFETATDLTTASHNSIILGSQRLYELFVNRDINQVEGMSSGDSYTTTDKLNFMPIGGHAHQGDKDGHTGFDTDYYGGIGYFEHDFSNNFKGGLGFAYMFNNTDFNDIDKSTGKIDSYRPFAYINYEQDAWRVDLAAGVAQHKINNNRKYSFNDVKYSARSKYDADEISGHLNIGYKIMLDNDMIFQPIVGFYAANLKTDTYHEKGTGPMNMNVKSEDYNSYKSMVGLKLKKDYTLDSGTQVIPELHLRWYHEMGDRNGGVSAYFLAQEQLFNTSGIEAPKDLGDIALRLTTKTGTNFDLFTEAYYQFGNKFYNAGGTVGLQYNF